MSDITKELMQYLEGITKCGEKVNGTNHYEVLIPEGMKLASIEKMNQYRNRFSGDMETRSIDSFSNYVNKHANEDKPAVCFIKSASPVARVIFDIGTLENPEHCEHRASLELVKTSAYNALLRVSCEEGQQFGHRNGNLTQNNLAEFIEDHSHCIRLGNNDGDISTNEGILAIRNVIIDAGVKSEHKINQLSTSTSAIEQIAAKSEDAPIPTRLYFKCNPYEGLKERELSVRISLGIDGREGIRFSLSIVGYEKEAEEMQEEFKTLVQGKMSDCIDTYIGVFNT